MKPHGRGGGSTGPEGNGLGVQVPGHAKERILSDSATGTADTDRPGRSAPTVPVRGKCCPDVTLSAAAFRLDEQPPALPGQAGRAGSQYYFIVPGLAGVAELLLDGDVVDEDPDMPPEVDESAPEPEVLLPVPDVPELPRPEGGGGEDPDRVDGALGIELDDPGAVLDVDEPGMLELSEDAPEPVVPDAPDDPDKPLPAVPDAPDEVSLPIMLPLFNAPEPAVPAPGVVEAPAAGLAEDAPVAELPAAPEDVPSDCAMATPADRDKRTAIAICFFIFHSSTC